MQGEVRDSDKEEKILENFIYNFNFGIIMKLAKVKGKKKLKCSKCGYSFFPRTEKEEIPFRCPYCSTKGSVSVAKHIVEEL